MKKSMWAAAALGFASAASVTSAQIALYPANNPGYILVNSDADTGVSTDKCYTHAVNIGETRPAGYTLNGVDFASVNIPDANYVGTYTGFDNTARDWAGFPVGGYNNNHATTITVPPGNVLSNMLVYVGSSGAPSPMRLSGLTPGAWHEFSLFMRNFGDSRPQNITYMPGTTQETTLRIDHNQFNPARLIVFRYQADESGEFAAAYAAVPGSQAICLSAFMNEWLQGVFILPTTGITESKAALHADMQFLETPSSVTVWWGFEDGVWQGSSDITGSVNAGVQPLAALATGLAPNTNHVFRFEAVTSRGAVWSDLGSFETLDLVPDITMMEVDAKSVSDVTAWVRVVWPGAPASTADITVWWGPADGGDTIAGWISAGGTAAAAPQCGIGDHPVAIQVPAVETPYYFRAFAANSGGGGTSVAPATRFAYISTKTPAQTRALYWGGGSGDIPNGTPLPTTQAAMNGTWDKRARNWCLDPHGRNYTTWQDGDDRVAVVAYPESNLMVTMTLATNVALNRVSLVRNYTGGPGGANQGTIRITSDPHRVLELRGEKPELALGGAEGNSAFQIAGAVELAAENGFAQSGYCRAGFVSRFDRVLGTVKSTGGSGLYGFGLSAACMMLGVTEFDLASPGGMALSMESATPERIASNAVIRLKGGAGLILSGNSNSVTNDFDRVSIEGHARIFLYNTVGALRAKNGVLRGMDGTGTLFLEEIDDAAGFFPARFIAQSGVPENVLLPWITCAWVRPVKLDPVTRMFERMEVEPAPDNLALWRDNECYRILGDYQPFGALGSVTVESLGVRNTNPDLVLTIRDGETLTIASGHLAVNVPYVGNPPHPVIFDGGKITSGTNQLHILAGGTNQRHLLINSEITGDNMDVITFSIGNIFWGGTNANTHTGTTYVNGAGRATAANIGHLRLAKTNGAIAIPGDIVINHGGILQPENHQIAPTSRVTIREGGYYMDSGVQIFNNTVTLENGTVRNGGQQFAAPGFGLVFANGGHVDSSAPHWSAVSHHLYTDVHCLSTSSNQAVFATNVHEYASDTVPDPLALRRLLLSPANAPANTTVTRTFKVEAADALPPGVPELLVDFPVASSDGRPVRLVKTGGGAMELKQLGGYFRGSAIVSNGVLLLTGPYARGTVLNADTTVANTGLNCAGSVAGLLFTQPVKLQNGNIEWISNWPSGGNVSLTFGAGVVDNNADYAFLACGPLGAADVVVEGGTLAGTSGVGGDLTLSENGALSPGTFAQPIGEFHVGGDLVFNNGSWQVDLDATGEACDVVHVAGDITFNGGAIEPVFHNSAKARPKGTWVIATFGGGAHGKISAPQGCSVRKEGNTLLFVSAEAGTLLMVR